VSYSHLSWDSDLFGFRIGRIDPNGGAALEEDVESAERDGARCVYLLLPAEDGAEVVHAIELGFRPYDIRVELEARIGDDEEADTSAVHEARAEDVPGLERIARTAFDRTRFFADGHFPHDRSAELYVAWLRRGLDSPERRTLVAGEADGFVICGIDEREGVGTIELIGVAEAKRGGGIGGALIRAAGGLFRDAGLSRATVVTQARNVEAQRAYQANGYRTAAVGVWLHRWAGQ
jgi:ribosomal protein S18 acetylase RimI-like enzyme